MRFALESWLLALICLLDMLWTAWLLKIGAAREANPILRFYVDLGIPMFVLVKSLLFVAPLYVLELLRRHRPKFIKNVLRVGIVCYVFTYGVGVLRVNSLNAGASVPPQVTQQAR